MRYLFFMLFSLFSFANELLLLERYEKYHFNDTELKSFVMSEKLDGVRAFWNGKNLISRGGFIIKAPAFFTQNFPAFAMDGELFIKRNDFDRISALIRSNDINHTLWQEVSYNVFDVPYHCENLQKDNCTLLKRLNLLENYLKEYPSAHLKIIPQIWIRDKKHLQAHFENLIKNGAEGLVLRKENAGYETKRSQNALKLKAYEDAECVVKGYTKGKGKFQEEVGALLCEIKLNGEKMLIKIGSGLKDEQRANPPKINSIITYKFNGYTKNGRPRFPVFLRIREE